MVIWYQIGFLLTIVAARIVAILNWAENDAKPLVSPVDASNLDPNSQIICQSFKGRTVRFLVSSDSLTTWPAVDLTRQINTFLTPAAQTKGVERDDVSRKVGARTIAPFSPCLTCLSSRSANNASPTSSR